MQIYEKTIKGNKWQLINEFWETSKAWGHKTTILRNGSEYVASKVRYYNRTWESYEYESSMLNAVDEIKTNERSKYINNYKYQNNVARFKKGEKEQVEQMFEKTNIARELATLKDAIRNRFK